MTMNLRSLPGKMRDKLAMSVPSLISSLTVYSTLREASNLRLTEVSARSAPSTTDSSPLNMSSGPSAPCRSCARRSFPAVAVLQRREQEIKHWGNRVCVPAVQRVVIEDFKDSFDDIGATSEHAERLLGASTEYPLGSSNTHSVYNIRSEPEWDRLWNGEKLPLVGDQDKWFLHTLHCRTCLVKGYP